MIELVDANPVVDVRLSEYKRLLGYPRRRRMSERARRLAHWARAWYARHASPWIYARHSQRLDLRDDSLVIDGQPFTSQRLLNALARSEAHAAVLVAVGAGPEIEQKAHQAWQQGRPDEYFFLEVFGSAVVEQLVTTTGARLCAWAEAQGMAVLPHDSPGYAEWDIGEQAPLLSLIKQSRCHALPGRLEVLESGMLRPKKSLLAVFGVTRHSERAARLANLTPCESCSFQPCQFRRKPYQRANFRLPAVTGGGSSPTRNGDRAFTMPLDGNANYAVNAKALARWADERLTLRSHADGSTSATFQFEGTTCTNQGRLLTFHYHVELGPRHEGYIIRDEHCGPAPGDTGHTAMCQYVADAANLMTAINREKPFLGRPLNDVLTWRHPPGAAGCYCEPADRAHKWRLVLETIHFALAQREKQPTDQRPQPVNVP